MVLTVNSFIVNFISFLIDLLFKFFSPKFKHSNSFTTTQFVKHFSTKSCNFKNMVYSALFLYFCNNFETNYI